MGLFSPFTPFTDLSLLSPTSSIFPRDFALLRYRTWPAWIISKQPLVKTTVLPNALWGRRMIFSLDIETTFFFTVLNIASFLVSQIYYSCKGKDKYTFSPGPFQDPAALPNCCACFVNIF